MARPRGGDRAAGLRPLIPREVRYVGCVSFPRMARFTNPPYPMDAAGRHIISHAFLLLVKARGQG